MRRAATAALALLALGAPALAAARREEPITPVPGPPPWDARAKLGGRLFIDPRLSGDGRRACASCHDLGANGADTARRPQGADGRPLPSNTPTVFNATLSFRRNWAGDRTSLEAQADGSLRNPAIMAAEPSVVLDRIRRDPRLSAAFQEAYAGPPTWSRLLDALAAFERTLVTPGSRFDAWLRGDARALTSTEQRGYRVFKSVGCASCHQGVNVGGNLFQQSGVFHPVAGQARRRIRVPGLRNVAETPPYFQNGSAPDLESAVRTMGQAQLNRTLDERQVVEISAFLRTLSGRYAGRPVRTPR